MKRLKQWLFYRPVPHLYPLICLGGGLVIYSGKWADIKLRRGWLVICWRKSNRYAYYSTNGTPKRATWGIGKWNTHD